MPILEFLELIIQIVKRLWLFLVNCHPFTDMPISLADIVAGLILFDIFWKILGIDEEDEDE